MNPEILNSIFHAYDIRGLVGSQLTDKLFYNLGKAFVTFLNAKNIAVGYDIRPESKSFADNFIKGATELGCNVKVVGEIATEMLYFAVGSDESLDGGATITASHNPAGYNGCKMVAKNVKPMSENWGLSEIKELLIKGSYLSPSETQGIISEIDIYGEYKTKVLTFLGTQPVKPLNIIVDAGNGAGGKIFDYIFGDLGLNITRMYFEPDGNFPNHVPDPLKKENVVELKKKVIEQQADLGIALDGDADRVVFIDAKGRTSYGVYTGSIFAKYFCSIEPNAKIVQDAKITWPIQKEVTKIGGIPLINKTGHSFMKERMHAENAIFGAEFSSHLYYRDYYYADSGMISIAVMLKLLSSGLNLVQELDYLYSQYIVSGEVNYKVEDATELIQKIKEHYPTGEVDETDGVSISFEDWRFNLRKSNTEPLLRLNIEGTSEAIVKEKFLELQPLLGTNRLNEPELETLLN